MKRPTSPKVVRMPPPKHEPEDGFVFSIGDDTFRVTASIEDIDAPKTERVVQIYNKTKNNAGKRRQSGYAGRAQP